MVCFGSAGMVPRVSCALGQRCPVDPEPHPLSPWFCFHVVQLQEDVQGIAEALLIGRGEKARGNAQFLFDHHTEFLWTGLGDHQSPQT